VTFPKAETLREAAAAVPDDRLLVETDSPYLAPIPHRGKRNEPAYVAKVVEQLAAARGVSSAGIGQQTDRNFDRLFRP
jgi:TatD DNase family protein